MSVKGYTNGDVADLAQYRREMRAEFTCPGCARLTCGDDRVWAYETSGSPIRICVDCAASPPARDESEDGDAAWIVTACAECGTEVNLRRSDGPPSEGPHFCGECGY
jgi:hypothetical protein